MFACVSTHIFKVMKQLETKLQFKFAIWFLAHELVLIIISDTGYHLLVFLETPETKAVHSWEYTNVWEAC